MKNNKLFKVLCPTLAALTLFLAACGNAANDGDTAADPTPEPATQTPAETPSDVATEPTEDEVTIRVAWWGGQTRHDLTMEVIELFESRFPHINVDYEFAGWDDYWTMLNTAAVGGDLPDVIQMDFTRIREFTENNLLIGLNPFIDSGIIDTSNIDMAAYQEILKVNGEYMGMSLGANAFAMVYNENLAAELGFEFTPDLTWDEYADFLRTVVAEREDFHGWGMGAEYEIFNVFVRDNGFPMYGDGELGFPREVLVDFFDMLNTFNEDGIIMSIERADAMNEGENALHHGLILSQMFASNQIVWQQGEVDDELGLALLPRVDGGVGGNWIRSSMQFAITSHSEQAEAAAQFIDFFLNDLEANEILQGERGAPISDAVRDHLRPLVDPVVVKTFDILPLVAAHSSPADDIPPVEQQEIRSIFLRAVEQVRHGALTPEEATDYVMDNAERTFSW